MRLDVTAFFFFLGLLNISNLEFLFIYFISYIAFIYWSLKLLPVLPTISAQFIVQNKLFQTKSINPENLVAENKPVAEK